MNKKMNIGKNNTNKSKNQMKQFILQTLNKAKVEECFVVRKGGNINLTNGITAGNDKSKLKSSQLIAEPHSIKSIKSSNDINERSDKEIKSHKNVDLQQKKRIEAVF